MWKEPLGADETFYQKYLKDIIPRLKAYGDTKYNQEVKILCSGIGIKPEIDEDVDYFYRDIVIQRIGGGLTIPEKYPDLTDVELLKRDVNALYLKIKKDGLIHYGRVKNKEHIFLYALGQLMLGYEFGPIIARHLTLDELQKMGEGHRRYLARWFAKGGVTTRSRFDKHSVVVYDWDKWIRSYKLPEGMSYEEKREFIATIDLKSTKMKLEFEMKLLMHISDIPPKWITLLRKLYCIKCLAKEEDREFLKGDSELQKIWGIPESTWRDKMKLLKSIDG